MATSDRNFYDRYFFNGYARDGSVFFAAAMGIYPNLQVHDASFCVVVDGKQHILRASKRLGGDRMAMQVGPVSVEITEPLQRLRIRVGDNEAGIRADLEYQARSLPFEEPHFYRRRGPNVFMDYTRMTQHGAWSGTLSLGGQEFRANDGEWWGTRDHSWGIRPVGGPDKGAPQPGPQQFFWNWAPVNFEDLCTLYTVSEHRTGSAGARSGAVLTPYPDAAVTDAAVDHDLRFASGTRHIGKGTTVMLQPEGGDSLTLEFEPLYHFLMHGLGYGHPTWGHGVWVGENESTYEVIDLADVDLMRNLHVQTVSRVRAGSREGMGVFESIVLGPHERYGFKETLDPAG
ncbi:MAG: hypothetical protein U5Q44_12960 [Dehalococcoidia bacterium]|nr:hypothetical protein [Dehalococcoidia bacterium]